MATIDNLQIDINAQATKANDAIERLIGKLDRLTTSLSRVEGGKLVGLANGVQRLGNAMQTMGNVKTTEFSRLTTNLKKINDVDTSNINQAAISMMKIGKSISGLSGVSVGAKNLAELANGIKQLGYKSAEQAIDNIPKIATAMKQLMSELSRAPKVSQNLIDMTNALAKLARTGASSGRAANSLAKSLDTYTASTRRASKGSFSLASAIGKVYASYWLLFRAFGGIRRAIDISSSLTEVQNVVDVTFGDMAYKVEEFAKDSIKNLGMSELSVKQYASRFQAMGSAMGIDPSLIGGANKYLSGVTDGYVGLSDSMADVSLNLTKLTADMASFYNVSQEDVAKDLEAVFTGETRPLRTYGIDLTQATLQEWAMKQGLDANIQSMSQAEKAVLRYQYVLANTGAAQRDFIRTQGTWANQVRILKEQFKALASVIGGIFINALKPLVKALNIAMTYIIEFAETISNALGKIFGWEFERGGGGMAQDFDDAAGSAGDIAGGMQDAEQAAKKLKTHLLGIDELNVVEPDTGDGGSSGGGGSDIGGGGTGAIGGQWAETESMLDGFESEIDTLFELGRHISDTLSNMLESINWEDVYEKARGFGSGLAEFLNGLITPELFRNLGKTIANSINTALQAANAFAIEFDWENLGKSIVEGIKSFFQNWDAELTAETFSNLAKGILRALKSAIDTLKDDDVFVDIGQRIVDLICGIDWIGIAWDLTGLFESLAKAMIDVPFDLAQGVAQGIIDKIFGEGTFDLEKTGITEHLKTVYAFFQNPIGTVGSISTETFASAIEKYYPEIEKTKEQFSEFWNNDIVPWFSFDTWCELASGILLGLQTKWEELKVWWSETAVVSWWDEHVAPWFTAKKWIDLYKTIKSSLKKTWDETAGKWISDIKLWWDEHVAPWFTAKRWADMLSKIPEAFKSAFKSAANFAIDMVNGVIGGIEGLVNGAIDGLKKLAKAVSKLPGIEIDIDSWGVSLPRIPRFEIGGFPEDGLFFANHNELVGQFSNGRTAVANNEMIVAGIEEAAYRGFSRAYAENNREARLLEELILAVREGKEITIDGRSLVDAYDSRKARNGFSFS